ncbi:transketolase family protein [Verrucomicrobiota bacterium]
MENITSRDAFWNRLYDIAKEDKDVILVSADMGAPSLDKFRSDLSGQYVNAGIAEQDALLIASGLAMEGKKTFAYAIAPFITLRPYEITKVAVAAMKLPITLVGVGAGFSYDDSGPTHHTLEDIALMRLLQGLEVNNITDSVMASALVDISYKMKRPNYIRLDRKPLPIYYDPKEDFSAGLKTFNKGNDLQIIATGNMVERAFEVSEELANKGIQVGVTDVYTFPVNESALIDSLTDTKRIVTLEEHILPGGLGSAVCEVLADHNRLIPCKRIGVDLADGYCYAYGGRENIQTLYGLDKDSIVKTITNWMK